MNNSKIEALERAPMYLVIRWNELSEEAKSKQALVVARARRFRGIKTAQSRERKSGPHATTAQDFAAEARVFLITLGLRYFKPTSPKKALVHLLYQAKLALT
jgi:hypothetical protein